MVLLVACPEAMRWKQLLRRATRRGGQDDHSEIPAE
jgi:hypothetical protein